MTLSDADRAKAAQVRNANRGKARIPDPKVTREWTDTEWHTCNTCGHRVHAGEGAITRYGRGGLHHIRCLKLGMVLANGEALTAADFKSSEEEP